MTSLMDNCTVLQCGLATGMMFFYMMHLKVGPFQVESANRTFLALLITTVRLKVEQNQLLSVVG